jgi:hypothetical protein
MCFYLITSFTTLTGVPHVALGFSRTSLPHDLIPTGHTDPASRRGRLRASTRSGAAGQELCGSLFWRRRSVRGRLPRRNALCLRHRIPDPFHRPQQRVRHFDAVLGAVLWRWDSGTRRRLRCRHRPCGRERRVGGAERDARGAS